MNKFIGTFGKPNPFGIINAYIMRLYFIPVGNWAVLPSNLFGGKPTSSYRI